MSAIAGILFYDGKLLEPGLIETLTGAMKRRGPDEQTHLSSGAVGLGHCMLRTTPESLDERQPVTSPDGNLTMVWDGRLDNRTELERELRGAGVSVRNRSDAELAFQCYSLWRDECPARLIGDFAFAVWDAEQSRLFCTRDCMGGRTLFHTRTETFFAFASEEEALLSLPGATLHANAEFVASYLMPDFRDVDIWQSWTENIRLLPSAQTMAISSTGEMHAKTYWELEEGTESHFDSDEQCNAAFLAVFGEAVRCRMRSAAPVSAMMSGGLDSAGISAMTQRLLPEMPGKEFHTYSAIADDPDSCVESQCIKSLTQDLAGNAHFVSVPSFSGMLDVKDLTDVAWSNAHPIDNSILLPEMMCLAASRAGHRVILYGGSGDLTMDVPERYIAHHLRARQWRRALSECTQASRNNTYLKGTSAFKLLLQNLWTAYVPAGIRYRARQLKAGARGHKVPPSIVKKEFAQDLRLSERIRATEDRPSAPFKSLQREHIDLLSSICGISSIQSSCDRIAGHYGIEARDPWADKRVVEFFVRLPLHQKVRNGWTKYLVRTAFGADLSPGVRWRLGKEHLGWNFVCRLLDESRDLIARTMEHGLTQIARYVDAETARKEHAKFQESHTDLSRMQIFRLMTLSLWVQQTYR